MKTRLAATDEAGMADRPRRYARLQQMMVTIAFAVGVIWCIRSFGRTLAFAFGINWILIVWATMLGHIIPLRLPAGYYTTRPFETEGRVYDYVGLRWYQRLFRPMLWSVNPALLRSEPHARETMLEATRDPETGHLLIFVVIAGITLWASASGWWHSVAWLLLFNVLHNVYPVLSMRQIRARLRRRSGYR